MNEELLKIVKESTFKVTEGDFVYCKVSEAPDINNHFMVSKDDDEITVVTKAENLSSLDLIEKNKDTYALVALNVSIPFYSVGFLAAVSNAIADKGMNILIISTYSKDYIMVKRSELEKARKALLDLGFGIDD